ncbi:rhodanese-like domain-containing protein [Undibacterium sp. Ren11W]|uniref:rhodanese-like domain-containing protein n=1 Tax=Undibacterium sp. Ren11W TaxID=3413045 RepID=UPI003BF2EA59
MKSKKIHAFWVAILLSLSVSHAVMAASPKSIDVLQVASLQNSGALLLDVRELDEYAEAHAPNSTLIPLGQLPQRLQELGADKSRPVILICRSGRRSAAAQALLEVAGFTTLTNVEGGMISWQKAGLPVLTGAAKSTKE